MKNWKFRVWDTHTKTFIYFGEEFHFDDTENTITFKCSPVLGERDPEGKRFIFQIFTTACDKKGKEIYEGDIVSMEVMKGKKILRVKVVFRGGHFIPRTLDEGKWEVIGNIFQNPEIVSC